MEYAGKGLANHWQESRRLTSQGVHFHFSFFGGEDPMTYGRIHLQLSICTTSPSPFILNNQNKINKNNNSLHHPLFLLSLSLSLSLFNLRWVALQQLSSGVRLEKTPLQLKPTLSIPATMRSSLRSLLLAAAAAAARVAAQGPQVTAPAMLGALGIGLAGNGTNATGDGKYTIAAEGIRLVFYLLYNKRLSQLKRPSELNSFRTARQYPTYSSTIPMVSLCEVLVQGDLNAKLQRRD